MLLLSVSLPRNPKQDPSPFGKLLQAAHARAQPSAAPLDSQCHTEGCLTGLHDSVPSLAMQGLAVLVARCPFDTRGR